MYALYVESRTKSETVIPDVGKTLFRSGSRKGSRYSRASRQERTPEHAPDRGEARAFEERDLSRGARSARARLCAARSPGRGPYALQQAVRARHADGALAGSGECRRARGG